LQLASLICASCEAGVRFVVLPKGLIIVETARFNLLGVLLKLKARPTFIFVLEANLEYIKEKLAYITESNYCQVTYSHYTIQGYYTELVFFKFLCTMFNAPFN
jgi:hypothetical protein